MLMPLKGEKLKFSKKELAMSYTAPVGQRPVNDNYYQQLYKVVDLCTEVTDRSVQIRSNEGIVKKNEGMVKKNEANIKKNEATIEKADTQIKKLQGEVTELQNKNEASLKKMAVHQKNINTLEEIGLLKKEVEAQDAKKIENENKRRQIQAMIELKKQQAASQQIGKVTTVVAK